MARAPSPNTGNVPFTGFQPSQQRDPRYDPNMVSTEDKPDADPLSPTTIVLNYLKERGYPLTAENIRRTVEANARDPGAIGGNVANYTRSGGGDVELRNASTEGTSASPAPRAKPGFPQPINPSWQTVEPWPTQSSSQPSLPNAGAPNGGLPLPPPMLPGEPSPVGGGTPPEIAPPPDPIRDAITRAISGPPEAPALPAPPVRPQIAAPPEVPALPAPSPQLALPAPEVPNVVGQSGRPALPAPQPDIGPKIAPGPRVQGAPIMQTPATRAIPRIVAGAGAGAARGGVPGAIAGGATAAAPELLDLGKYIAKGLHLY